MLCSVHITEYRVRPSKWWQNLTVNFWYLSLSLLLFLSPLQHLHLLVLQHQSYDFVPFVLCVVRYRQPLIDLYILKCDWLFAPTEYFLSQLHLNSQSNSNAFEIIQYHTLSCARLLRDSHTIITKQREMVRVIRALFSMVPLRTLHIAQCMYVFDFFFYARTVRIQLTL